uniref:Putative secreted protein n=1 Tax=Anopheles darlingi TaxID=43151 RepID=A0A2M4DJB3_ANODA
MCVCVCVSFASLVARRCCLQQMENNYIKSIVMACRRAPIMDDLLMDANSCPRVGGHLRLAAPKTVWLVG